jgi:hypothetical protein
MMRTKQLSIREVIEMLHGFIDLDNMAVHQVYQVQELMQVAREAIELQEGLIENLNVANHNLDEAWRAWKAEYEKIRANQPKPEVVKCRYEIIVQTYRMRRLQKDYFLHKSPSVLVQSKNVEARVDRLLAELEQLTNIKLYDLIKNEP